MIVQKSDRYTENYCPDNLILLSLLQENLSYL